MTRRRGTEGKVLGEESDEKFHTPILGDDRLPPEVLDDLRQLARRLGIDADHLRLN